MRVNPRTKYFIENLIPSSEETPYFLWTEEDVSFFRLIIKETAVSSKKAELLEEYSQDEECFDPEKGKSGMWQHKRTTDGKRISNPYRSPNPYNQLVELQRKLTYNRKDSGRHLVERTVRQYYPEVEYLDEIKWIAYEVQEISKRRRMVQEGIEKFDRIISEIKTINALRGNQSPYYVEVEGNE